MSTIESNSDGSGRKLAAKRGGDRRGEVPLSAENYPCLGRRRFLAGLAAMATPSLLGSRVVRAAAPAGSPGKTSPTAPACANPRWPRCLRSNSGRTASVGSWPAPIRSAVTHTRARIPTSR